MKNKRQREILEIITQHPIGTQGELVAFLEKKGQSITQATISRDINELGLIKLMDDKGRYRYMLPAIKDDERTLSRFDRTVKDTVIHVDFTENMVLVKTVPGSAQLMASLLDNSGWEDIMGTIAGDDVVLLIIKDKQVVPNVCQRIKNKMG